MFAPAPTPVQAESVMPSSPAAPPGVRRRDCLLAAALPWCSGPGLAADGTDDTPVRLAMRRAEAMRDDAVRAGDQPFGAVVLRGEVIVGAAPSRVVTATDPTAHAEMEAIRAAVRRPALAAQGAPGTARCCGAP
ncbi:MAG: MafB19-like deaminase [Pseudomonadota bacterium]